MALHHRFRGAVCMCINISVSVHAVIFESVSSQVIVHQVSDCCVLTDTDTVLAAPLYTVLLLRTQINSTISTMTLLMLVNSPV